MPVAYAPRAGYTAASVGAFIAVGDQTLDVKAAFKKGGGQIVVPDHDTLLQLVLDEHPALKRVSAKDTDSEQVSDRFEDMTATQLRDVAKAEYGIDSPPRSRDDLLAAVRAAANDDQPEG